MYSMYNEVATISNSQGSFSAGTHCVLRCLRHHFKCKPKLSHEDATFFGLLYYTLLKPNGQFLNFSLKKGVHPLSLGPPPTAKKWL